MFLDKNSDFLNYVAKNIFFKKIGFILYCSFRLTENWVEDTEISHISLATAYAQIYSLSYPAYE